MIFGYIESHPWVGEYGCVLKLISIGGWSGVGVGKEHV